jgi:hypothetical protein
MKTPGRFGGRVVFASDFVDGKIVEVDEMSGIWYTWGPRYLPKV